MRKHCCSAHGQSSGPRGRKKKKQQQTQQQQPPPELYSKIALQTLWAEKKHISYFVVQAERGEPELQQPYLEDNM